MRISPVCLRLLTIGTLGLSLICVGVTARPRVDGRYVATAYSQTGITASGEYTHRHIVAADPDILPIGSRIKIRNAGKYSGEYVVADTGQKIQGRRLDIYMPNTAECKKFGVKRVRVRVVQLGDGTHAAAKTADTVVKQEVSRDVEKGTVGNAATETDWVKQGAPTVKSIADKSAPSQTTQTQGQTRSPAQGSASSQQVPPKPR